MQPQDILLSGERLTGILAILMGGGGVLWEKMIDTIKKKSSTYTELYRLNLT